MIAAVAICLIATFVLILAAMIAYVIDDISLSSDSNLWLFLMIGAVLCLVTLGVLVTVDWWVSSGYDVGKCMMCKEELTIGDKYAAVTFGIVEGSSEKHAKYVDKKGPVYYMHYHCYEQLADDNIPWG